jgi:hypothetical protein
LPFVIVTTPGASNTYPAPRIPAAMRRAEAIPSFFTFFPTIH